MQVVLVGQQNGRRRVRWSTAIWLALLLGFVLGVVGSITYLLIAGQWSVYAALIAAMGGIVVVGVGLIRSLKTPIDKLTPLA